MASVLEILALHPGAKKDDKEPSKEPSKEPTESTESTYDAAEMQAAANELMDALKANDVSGVAAALRDAFEACQEKP